MAVAGLERRPKARAEQLRYAVVASPTFKAPKGTRDILAPESTRWRGFVAIFADLVEAAGYGQVIPPMFEDASVFHRLGEATDVVRKEMYVFEDQGGRSLALRPEHTASVVRSFVEHRPPVPWKTWYAGSNFRQERAQRGRYRQFDQVGIEVLGIEDPLVDAEVISLAWQFYERLGLRHVRLLLNSLGGEGDRKRYEEALRSYFEARRGELSEQSQATLDRNPLRVLDSKRDEDSEIVAAAPLVADHLASSSTEKFERVQDALTRLSVPFELAPRLVRGLDYYRETTFEFVSDALVSAQNAIGGGGRYDGLAEDLGGPATPGIGFALGVDRTLLACDDEGVFPAPSGAVDVYVIDTTGGFAALELTDEIRRCGFSSDRSFGDASMRAQIKGADRSGARVAVIVGESEAESNMLSIRDLRLDGGQVEIPRDQLISQLTQRLLK